MVNGGQGTATVTERYTTTAILLHWAIALLIFATFPLGLYMADLPVSPQRLKLFSYHKWIGVTVFFLVAIRLAWRSTHAVPAPMAGMPRWQEIASNAVHQALYVFMAIVPISGWLMSSAHGFRTVWFGVLPLPNLLEKNEVLGQVLGDVHETLNWIMLAFVMVHIAAALKHHFVDRDGLLNRMNPMPLRREIS